MIFDGDYAMKRLLMQIFRTIVTLAIMGTMAAMIFSLRAQLAEANAKVQALEKALNAQAPQSGN